MKKTDSSGEIQISSQTSVARAKVLGNEANHYHNEESDIIDITYEDVKSHESGKQYQKKITRKYIPRRTYLKGYLKGKYRGELETGEQSKKDIGTYFDISIYESEVFSNWEDIVTDKNILYSNFEAGIIQNFKTTKIIDINKSQLQNNVLVVGGSPDPSRFKIDLFEPRIFNVKIVRELHQTAGDEVFGVIEANIFGYLLDKIEVVEEVIQEVLPLPVDKNATCYTEGTSTETEQEPEVIQYRNWFDELLKTTWGCLPFIFGLLGIITLFLFTGGLPGLIIVGLLLFLAYTFKWRSSKISWIFSLLFFGLLAFMFFSFFNNRSVFDDTINKIENMEIVRQTAKIRESFPFGKEVKNSNTTSSQDRANLVAVKGKELLPASPQNKMTKTDSAIKQQSTDKSSDKPMDEDKLLKGNFENFLDAGLEAVENEEYKIANRNFQKAAALQPQNPRLRDLAAEYIKIGNEKCQEFKNAKANNLKYIPNNYYQYAASLTQNKPLLCD